MKNRKVMIIAAVVLLSALCVFLLFGNKSDKPSTDQGGLQLGLINEEKDDSKEKKDSQNKEDNPKDESNPETPDENNSKEDVSSSDSGSGNTDVPEGGQAVDNGDGSVNIVINDDEDTFGI